jgi:hypothetical protein
MSKEIEYWDCDDCAERLCHESIDDAIEDYLDGADRSDLSETLEVYGYARMSVDPEKFKEVVLELAGEYLGEEFDGEDGHEQNEEIERAAESFVKTYLENYTPWGCKLVKTEKVNVEEWVKKNRPDWLKSGRTISLME